MMTDMKRRHLLILLLLLLLGSPLLLPQVRWPVYGWLRGEAFYQGMPTSWWAKEIDTTYQPMLLWDISGKDASIQWCMQPSPSLWDEIRQQFGPSTTALPASIFAVGCPLLDGDPDALPVLLVLVRNESAKVRRAAIRGLWAEGEGKPEIISALIEAVRDTDAAVQEEAVAALQHFNSNVEAKAGANEAVHDPKPLPPALPVAAPGGIALAASGALAVDRLGEG